MKAVLIDLVGQRFGRLTVTARAENATRGQARWACACDCGGHAVVRGSHLRAGAIESCGCIHRETTAAIRRTHGRSRTATHVVWRQMIQRCTDPNSTSFADYGGRGIRVCERWRHSFATFLVDMGERPEGKTIDRIDNEKGYEPGNCRWATRIEQNNNTRRNRFLSAFGRTQTAAQWSREIGISAHAILKRIARGWPVERALAP